MDGQQEGRKNRNRSHGRKRKKGNGERKKRICGRKYSGLERKYISIICTQISSATKLICCYLLIPNSYDEDILKNVPVILAGTGAFKLQKIMNLRNISVQIIQNQLMY